MVKRAIDPDLPVDGEEVEDVFGKSAEEVFATTSTPPQRAEIAEDVLGYYMEQQQQEPQRRPQLQQHQKRPNFDLGQKKQRLRTKQKKLRRKGGKTGGHKSHYFRHHQSPAAEAAMTFTSQRTPQYKQTTESSSQIIKQFVPKTKAKKKMNSAEDVVDQLIPKKVKKVGRKVLRDVFGSEADFMSRQGFQRSFVAAFAPEHVTGHLVAQWVNIFAISVAWIGLGAMYKTTLATGRSAEQPWERFIPDSSQVASMLRNVADVADQWHHDEL